MEDRIMLGVIQVHRGKEDAYREWHDHHMAQVVDFVPAIVKARRYELVNPTDPPEDFPMAQFVVVYEIDGTPESVRDALDEGRATGKVSHVQPDVIAHGYSLIYEAGADGLSI